MPHGEDLRCFADNALTSLLEGLLSSSRMLSTVAARSYGHDNGFVKIVLSPGASDGRALRLHLWPADEPDDGNIHNHCWAFTSIVLAGELAFDEYVVDETGEVAAQHFAYVPATDLAYGLEPLGPSRLRLTDRGIRAAGELYEMSSETLHRTSSRGSCTVTLLAQGERRRKNADVFITREGATATTVTNSALEPDELKAHLETVLRVLARPSA